MPHTATLLDVLAQRGLTHDCSHAEELNALLEKSKISFYCGFDPTADSLHVGSMLPLLVMRRFQRRGHQPIALIGSATGMIGDPSGKSAERQLLDEETLEKNIAGMQKQFSLFLDDSGPQAFKLVHNDSWIRKLNCIDFLRDVGKHFSVNAMMAKESVRDRLHNREQGISYTEFSYMLLQAYDFYHLFTNEHCVLQVGGSDQWGNITAGIDLIRRRSESARAYGLTFPLLTTSSGKKFGKTEAGTVWLDEKKTSAYQFYQYWLNTADEDVVRFLLLFTELEQSEIDALRETVQHNPQAREAQRVLAEALTTLVHGAGATQRAVDASRVLFGSPLDDISASTLREIFADVPSLEIDASELTQQLELLELLARTGLAKSKGEGRRLVDGGGVYLNNHRINESARKVSAEDLIQGEVLVLRSGKKNYALITVRK